MTSNTNNYKPSIAGSGINNPSQFAMRSTQSLSQRHTMKSNAPDAGLELYASEFLDVEADLPKRSFGEVQTTVVKDWWSARSKLQQRLIMGAFGVTLLFTVVTGVLLIVLNAIGDKDNELTPFNGGPSYYRPVRYDNMTIPLGVEEAKMWSRNDYGSFFPVGAEEYVDPRLPSMSHRAVENSEQVIVDGQLPQPETNIDVVRENWVNYMDKLTDRYRVVSPNLEERIRDVTFEPIAYDVATGATRPLYTGHPTVPDLVRPAEDAAYFVWPKKTVQADSHQYAGIYSKWLHYSGPHKLPEAVVSGKPCQSWAGTVSQLVDHMKSKLSKEEVHTNDLDCYKMTGYIEKYDESLKLPVAYTPTYDTGVIAHQTTSYSRVSNATVNS